MANDTMSQFRYSYEKAVVDIFANISFGATGAPTLVSGKNFGITAITRTSAGLYVIKLKSKFNRLLLAKHIFLNATAPASSDMFVVTDNSAGTTPSITVQFNAAGVATDPGSGEVVLLQICLKNSSV